MPGSAASSSAATASAPWNRSTARTNSRMLPQYLRME